MAAMVRLRQKTESCIDDVYQCINDAEDERIAEYNAAVRVQAWFRGTKTRKYLQYLSDCATKIQALYRGHLGRKNFRLDLARRVDDMVERSYHKNAIKIQKVWRGYIARKYAVDYHSRSNYLEALEWKNAIVRKELEAIAEYQAEERRRKEEDEARQKLHDYTSKHHYLVSTLHQPGIFNNPFKPEPDDIEFLLRTIKPRVVPKPPHEEMFDPAAISYDLPMLSPLPPLGDKPQGPFRSPEEVQHQRYRRFKPSLRVQTDFYALEKARKEMKEMEWVGRLYDDVLLHGAPESAPYQRLLHASSSYGDLPYGTQHFRCEEPDRWVNVDFQKVVPPIPLFDKLNKTYSKGEA